MQEDGGYYAIKGFEYQWIQTIGEILTSARDMRVSIEQDEDYSNDDMVVQVKHKETASFSENKIRRPVVKLINRHRNGDFRSPRLCVHFKDGFSGFCDSENRISRKSLDKILGPQTSEFSNKELENFVKVFVLDFSGSYQKEFTSLIDTIKSKFGPNCSETEAVLYYSWIAHHLRNLVTNNAGTAQTDRSCSMAELEELIHEGKREIFDSGYLEYLGKEQYLKLAKSRFKLPQHTDNNVVIIQETEHMDQNSITDVILSLTEKRFAKSLPNTVPLMFVLPQETAVQVKRCLIDKAIAFNDGYESLRFSSDLLFRPPLVNRKMAGDKAADKIESISFKLRIISTDAYETIDFSATKVDRIYIFGESGIRKPYDVPTSQYAKVSTTDIDKMFR